MQQPPARPLTSADFQAMIPAHFISGAKNIHVDKNEVGPSVTVTVNTGAPDMPMLPPAPTELGKVTETITKSTITETVMTRVTDNRLSEPLVSEVNMNQQLNQKKKLLKSKSSEKPIFF